MADSLDDFFAKKDKSKKKSKSSKYTASDLLARREGDGQEGQEKVPPPKSKVTSSRKKNKEEKQGASEGVGDQQEGQTNPNTEQDKVGKKEEEEEWSEYVEEKETDYSGLRIQSIQIRDEENEKEDKERSAGGEGDEDEGEEKNDSSQSAWMSNRTQAPPPKPVETPVKEEPEAAPLPNVKSGKYVPPNLRNASATPEVTPSRANMRRKKEAPNIQSEEDFPTLGGPGPEDHSSHMYGARFEKVRSGGRQMDDQTNRGPRLELGNKYDALRGGDD